MSTKAPPSTPSGDTQTSTSGPARRLGTSRRAFLAGAGAAALGVELLADASPALASGGLTPGDAALLRFAAAAEILETDFGSSTTSSGACRTARFLAGAAARHTRQPYRCWIRTWPSTST